LLTVACLVSRDRCVATELKMGQVMVMVIKGDYNRRNNFEVVIEVAMKRHKALVEMAGVSQPPPRIQFILAVPQSNRNIDASHTFMAALDAIGFDRSCLANTDCPFVRVIEKDETSLQACTKSLLVLARLTRRQHMEKLALGQ